MSLSEVKGTSGYYEEFSSALNERNTPTLLRLWEEYTSSDEVDPEDFRLILEAVKKSDLRDYIGRHIERSLHLWQNVKGTEKGDEILRLIVDLEMNDSEDLRQIARDHLDEKFSSDQHHSHKMRLVNLRGTGDSFQGAISNYLLLNHMKPGAFVFHKAGWGVGEVVEVSMLREEAIFEFDYVPGQKHLTFAACFGNLDRLDESHFLAQRFGFPDRLEEKARKQPLEVIRMLLHDLGPKSAAEIRDELCELVIPENDWNKWWQMARTKMKKDTHIENPPDLKSPFKLMEEEVSHEERLQRALDKKPETKKFIQLIHSHFKDYPDTLKNQEFKASLLEKVTEMLASPDLKEEETLSLLFFLEELGDGQAKGKIQAILKEAKEPIELIQKLTIQSLKKRAILAVKQARDDAAEILLGLLFLVEYTPLRDTIYSLLYGSKHQDMLEKKLSELIKTPGKYPEALFWYFQKAANDASIPFASPLSALFEAFLILLAELEYKEGMRDMIKKMQAYLLAKRYAIVRQVMKEASLEDTKEFLLLVTKCHSLTEHDIKIFHSLAQVVHPELATEEASTSDENEVLTTKTGYAALQKRIEHIGTVETVENAKEIEVARAHGDLRENAEFKAALERRDRLQAELKMLSDQIHTARVVSKEEIDSSQVSFGCKVTCKTGSGEQIVYTLLGPWEADSEKQILSYQSKLAKAMMGKKIGDVFEHGSDKLTIEKIENAL